MNTGMGFKSCWTTIGNASMFWSSFQGSNWIYSAFLALFKPRNRVDEAGSGHDCLYSEKFEAFASFQDRPGKVTRVSPFSSFCNAAAL
ncbi:hypothetical protein L596_015691 [Steinernema carpocapsae]|uniref:Uncharacterized protein n=1 Tax=Steinernema carpocapsae TaxID=34508 RepID=A0A4U5NGZ9_STECR|nr:hypothetical protein L596_015691 [Steinernema carpocapsae]